MIIHHWEQLECKMNYLKIVLMQIRHLLRHEYPEGLLINECDIFCRQNAYDPPITKMDQLIDTMSEEVIKKYTNNTLIVNISEKDLLTPVEEIHEETSVST